MNNDRYNHDIVYKAHYSESCDITYTNTYTYTMKNIDTSINLNTYAIVSTTTNT